MDSSQRRCRTRALLAVALLLFVGSTACDKESGIPGEPDERVATVTKTLPASSTTMVALFSDLPAFGQAIEETKKTASRVMPVDQIIEQSVNVRGIGKFFSDEQKTFGDTEFWKERGIPPKKGSVGFAQVDGNTVLFAFVEDAKKFRKVLKESLGAEKTESITVGGQSATKSTDGTTAAWAIDGKLAVAAAKQPDASTDTDVTATLERVLSANPKESVHSTKGFTKYGEAVGTTPGLVYLQPSVYLDSGRIDTSNLDEQTREQIRASLDGAGLDVEVGDNRVTGRLWLGMTKTGRKYVDDWFKSPTKADWSNFVNDDLALGVRMGGNWKNVFNSYKSALADQQKKALESQLQTASDQLGMDLEKKLIGNMTGQSGLFVYGVGGKFTPEMMSRPTQLIDKIRIAFVMKFANGKVLGRLAESISEAAGERVEVRPLRLGEDKTVRSIDAIDVSVPKMVASRMPMGNALTEDESGEAALRFYAHKDRLIAATTSIPETTIHAMLTGKNTDTKSLTDVEALDLGSKFATNEELSGLYFNVVRTRDIMSQMLRAMPIPQLKKVAQTLQEVLLSAEPKNDGMFVDLSVDMEPDSGSSETRNDKKKK